MAADLHPRGLGSSYGPSAGLAAGSDFQEIIHRSRQDLWQGHWPPTVFAVACVGVLMAYIYSAPPPFASKDGQKRLISHPSGLFPRLKLKQNWISGCYALGSSYIALPWLAGQCTFGEVTPEIIVLTLWYSVAAVGIAIVNDFKSVEGAQHMLKPLQIQSTQFKTYQKRFC